MRRIIPQAICTRYGLAIGANLAWLVWIIIVLLFPISWPISLLLDFLLGGEQGTFFRRARTSCPILFFIYYYYY